MITELSRMYIPLRISEWLKEFITKSEN